MQIRPFRGSDLEAVVALSLGAWEPVFRSLEAGMDPAVFEAFYPGRDWRPVQRKSVVTTCGDGDNVWVAESEGAVIGFAVLRFHGADKLGEIYMLAVDPAHQGKGVGSRLTEFSLERFRAAGMGIAMVETGGDEGHAPARRTYERAGFRALPLARFFRKL